jgi:conjugative transfer region protein TrbK
MDSKTFARIGAIALAAVAITAGVIDGTRKPDAPEVMAATPLITASDDPLGAELARCSGLGEAGERDTGCLAAWAQNRRRFLGEEH